MTRPIALITGGAQGIGFACAQAIAENGARIVIADINGEKAIKAAGELGDGAVAVTCDMSEPAQIAAMFDTIEADVGPVSILVNNAGVSVPSDFLETTLEDFQKVLNVNTTGVFLATQRAAKTMVSQGIKGAIVNMSSVNAVVSIPTIVAYCTSKGGVMQMTKATSVALAPYGIRVNAVGPGSIDTDMLASVNSDEEARKILLSRTPLQRVGTAREIGDVVAFLASEKASYITGETIYVDGGRLGMNYTVRE